MTANNIYQKKWRIKMKKIILRIETDMKTIRIPTAKNTSWHKDKSKYRRKQKHKKLYDDKNVSNIEYIEILRIVYCSYGEYSQVVRQTDHPIACSIQAIHHHNKK